LSRIIGVLNFKGGTGKTTTVVNLAAGLAEKGQRVLCIDLDAQGSIAAYFGAKYNYSIYHLVLMGIPATHCVLRVRPNLDILPSDKSILEAQGYLWRMNDDEAARQILPERLKVLDDYDFVIVDYSPSASILSESGMMYIRELIVPISMNHFAVVGFVQVSKTLRDIGRVPDHNVRLSKIVPTFFDGRRRKDREILESLQRRFPEYITEPVRQNVKLAEAPGKQQTIFEYAPTSYGAEDYKKLVELVLQSAPTN
jgi:chromosome partitioning protein